MENTFVSNGQRYEGTEDRALEGYANFKICEPTKNYKFEEWVAAYLNPVFLKLEPKEKFTEAERKFLDYQNNQSGSFYKSLVHTIICADDGHQNKLAKAYPELVEVIRRYQTEEGYWQSLEDRWNKFINPK